MSDHDQPVAANLLDPVRGGGAESTLGRGYDRVRATSGKLYLAVILDLFSRFVVGWALSAVNDRHLTIKALEMALSAAPTSGSCITTRAARTRARTTRTSSTRAASSAA